MTGSVDRSRTRIRVVCDEPGAYHAQRGSTTFAGYERIRSGRNGSPYWSEVRGKSTRTERADRAWYDSLTEAEEGAVMRNEEGAPSSPFPGALNPGVRPATTEYLRGDEPPGDDSHHIKEALTLGTRSGALGTTPARPEDVAGRGKITLSCGCGIPGPRRARAEDIWAVFDVLVENRIHQITLKQLIARLDAPGAPYPR
jgi:hypothetical protein